MPNRKDFTVINGNKTRKDENKIKTTKKCTAPQKDVKNEELEEALASFNETHSMKSMDLVSDIIRDSLIIAPVLTQNNMENCPLILTSENKENVVCVYTSKESLLRGPKTEKYLVLPFINICRLVLSVDDLTGVVINPASQNILFKKPFLEIINNGEHISDKKPTEVPVQISKTQLQQIERYQFEHFFLPKKFFSEKDEFLKLLKQERESYINNFFKMAFKMKSEYPYKKSDFSVMDFMPDDDTIIYQIGMPDKNHTQATGKKIFLINRKDEYYYFVYMLNEQKTYVISKVDESLKHEIVLENISEGTEIRSILNLLGIDF